MSRPFASLCRQRLLRAAALTLTLAAIALPGCRSQQTTRELPPIFFVSLDTLRWDALGATRGEKPSLTPSLDQFAADSVLLTKVVVPMPFTLASHMSMFTGLYPHRFIASRHQRKASPAQHPDFVRNPAGGRLSDHWQGDQ